jgi:hypothetical protein
MALHSIHRSLMPPIDLDLPPDVIEKLSLYQRLYAMQPSEVISVLARVQHVTTAPMSAKDVIWLVRHSKLRQFPGHGLETGAHAAD